MINAAIIGLGWWGQQHVKSVQGVSDRVRYVLGVTKEPDEIADFATGHDLPIATEYEDALNHPDVEAVVLATPHSLHLSQMQAAAAAGKHVFCEKPFALNVGDARTAVAAVRDAGLALGIGQNRRHWPALKEIKRMIDAGELGRIMHVEANYSHDILADVPEGTWRTAPDETPAGGMTGMGVHVTDAWLNMIGPVKDVYAKCVDRVLGRPSGDTVSVLLTFENGVTGYLGVILKTTFIWHFRVFGEEGYVESWDENSLSIRMRNGDSRDVTLDPVDSVLAELEAFADAVEGKAPFPVPDDQIIGNVATLEAIFKSVEIGDRVTL